MTRRTLAAGISPALRFVLLEIVKDAAERHVVHSDDIAEMTAKTEHYERNAKTDPGTWLEDAKEYRRELNEAKRDRKRWRDALSELRLLLGEKPKTRKQARKRQKRGPK